MNANFNYTSKMLNGNFKIKVFGEFEGKKINTLVGVKGFLEYVADNALANRLVERALNSMDDKCVCKLRRGIRVALYRW